MYQMQKIQRYHLLFMNYDSQFLTNGTVAIAMPIVLFAVFTVLHVIGIELYIKAQAYHDKRLVLWSLGVLFFNLFLVYQEVILP